jgi:hypothetical protein
MWKKSETGEKKDEVKNAWLCLFTSSGNKVKTPKQQCDSPYDMAFS